MGHPVIMGRKTWESIPEKFRPLEGRTNIIVTRNEKYQAPDECIVMHSPEQALVRAQEIDESEVFIIGGEAIYKTLLPETDKLYLTIVEADKPGDTFFPEYKKEFTNETFNEANEHAYLKYTWKDIER